MTVNASTQTHYGQFSHSAKKLPRAPKNQFGFQTKTAFSAIRTPHPQHKYLNTIYFIVLRPNNLSGCADLLPDGCMMATGPTKAYLPYRSLSKAKLYGLQPTTAQQTNKLSVQYVHTNVLTKFEPVMSVSPTRWSNPKSIRHRYTKSRNPVLPSN